MSAPPKSEGAARQDSPHTRHDLRSSSRYQNPADAANVSDGKRVIQISHEPFGCGFDVKVIPPVEPSLDQEFATYKQARGYGGGLRLVQGWHLVDLTGEASNG